MSVPYNPRTNEDRRRAVGGFLNAVIGNPFVQSAVDPRAAMQNTFNLLASKNVGQTISPQQAQIRQGQQQNLAGRQHVQGWLDGMKQQGLVDPNNPEPPAGVEKALSGQGRSLFQNIGTQVNAQPQVPGQPQPQQMIGGDPRQGGGSFANMVNEAARIKDAGGDLPFQDLEGTQDIAESFNKSSGTGGTRLTNWDTQASYQVVNKLDIDEMRELESITDRDEYIETTADTTLNLLEDSGYVMSDEQEASFKQGIDGAMQEWFDTRMEKGQSTALTDYLVGMTSLAVAHIVNSQQAAGTAPAQAGAGQSATPTEVSPQAFLEGEGQGQIPPEFYSGFYDALEQNPDLTIEQYLAGGR